MTDITTEAGKRLHDARHLPDYCSDPCELREEVAAIESEAREQEWRSYRSSEFIRAAVLARVRERVEGLPVIDVTNARWDVAGVLHIDHASLGTSTPYLDRAAVLAILEEEA